MLELKFGTRDGNHEAFTRVLAIREDEGEERVFVLAMTTDPATKKRHGMIAKPDRTVVWTGELPGDTVAGPPPTRAFAIAAGLCDNDGGTDLPLPAWAE